MTTLSFMLAKEYHKGMEGNKKDTSLYSKPPIHWFMSEKYDGYRACYNPEDKQFYSRQNKLFRSPEWFKSSIPPKIKFDGELWAGRENFQLMGTVRKKEPIDEEWLQIQYIVYDLPDLQKPFKERVKELEKIQRIATKRWKLIRKDFEYPYNTLECPFVVCDQIQIKQESQLDKYYQTIIAEGGEGIMLKHPECDYTNGRCHTMLKYKPTFDAEAMIIDYKQGEGKYKGMLGGFICQPLINHGSYSSIDTNKLHQFSISGMDDSVRKTYKKTHPLRSIITYEYSGVTDSGKPRFARYIRLRDDITIQEHKNVENCKDTIIHQFQTLGKHESMEGNSFKASSYFKAISILQALEDSDMNLVTISQQKGIGKSLLQKIEQILHKGTCEQYQKIKDKNDPRSDFMKIYGVGPKKATDLVSQGFTSIQDLRDSLNLEKIFNQKQMIGLHYYEDINARIPRSEIVKHESYLQRILQSIDPKAELTIAGSYRRGLPESGDIDILLTSPNESTYQLLIDTLKQDSYLMEHLAEGPKKYMGLSKLKNHRKYRRIDIMFTSTNEYPFAILYFTGSKDFNTKMRQEALNQGYSMNEYSLTCVEEGSQDKKLENASFLQEKDIFNFLQIDYVEPSKR